MATTAVEAIFIDTNVLVFSTIRTAPLHEVSKRKLRSLREAGHQLWLSRQVLREYLAVLTRPQTFSSPLEGPIVAADIELFERTFAVADDGPDVTRNLLRLVSTIQIGGKQIHDANIVATMRARGVNQLLSHNVADFARYSSLITVLPLVAAP